MKIRLAVPADAAFLAEIEAHQPMAAGWGLDGLQAEIFQSYAQIWCAEKEGQIIAFLALRAVGDFAEILNVAVSPKVVRQGIGFALISHALQQVRLQGVRHFTLEVAQDNAPACGLYTKVGFEPLSRRKDFYAPGRDALVMGLTV